MKSFSMQFDVMTGLKIDKIHRSYYVIFHSLQFEPEYVNMYPGDPPVKVQLNLTIPYLCPFDSCSPMRIELYMHNNRKPMCQLGNPILGAPKTDFTDETCWSEVKPVFRDAIKPQFATFDIEVAPTSLITQRSYVIKASFKTSSDVPDQPIWKNFRPPPFEVRH